MSGGGDPSRAEDEGTEYTVTFLEMTAPPAGPRPSIPSRPALALLVARRPPVRWFLHLYDSVGADYRWTDRHRDPPEVLAAFVSHPAVEITTLMVDGYSGGFFMLDRRAPGICDLAYFGLAPEAVGLGLGRWFLSEAVHAAWAGAGSGSSAGSERGGGAGGRVGKVTVNTCTFDHPAALQLYQKLGFRPVRRETRRAPAI